jgi:hypothetical protein
MADRTEPLTRPPAVCQHPFRVLPQARRYTRVRTARHEFRARPTKALPSRCIRMSRASVPWGDAQDWLRMATPELAGEGTGVQRMIALRRAVSYELEQ